MMKSLIGLNFFLLCCIVLLSCSKDDTYTYLTDEAKEFLLYEEGDTFQLKNVSTDEIITFTVDRKNFDLYESSGTPGGIYSGFNRDSYYEYGEYNFTGDMNCYDGTIYIEARSNGNFELTSYISECFGHIYNSFEFQDEILTNIVVDGIVYTDVYLIRSSAQTIFYSKDSGIIQIVDNFSQETQFIIIQ